MRITNKMTIANTLANLQINQAKLDKTNNKLSSGKRISIPEDDPTGTIKAMGYRSNLKEIDQYLSNVDNAKTVLNSTDVALSQVTNILQRTRELSVKAANGTFEQNSRDAIADEITQLTSELVGIANSKVGSKYIFGGYETTEAPFQSYNGDNDSGVSGPGGDLTDVNGNVRTGINNNNVTVVKYNGDSGRLQAEIDENVKTSFNISGKEIFIDSGNIFQTMMDLRDSIYSGEISDKNGDGKSVGDGITQLETSLTKILRYRSEVGAKMNRMDQAEIKLKNQTINITDLLSRTEDTDVTKTIMDLKVQESVQSMSLSVGAKVIQPTLMDFLR
ncbi:flagellar hook-associated protein FlgL [Haliovirga abyssi]|uniref:Flagellar hook-associated protein FlgL n=1 Tax=Haliovirga abyssi TaxID=2996794 RepID=A0AAU9DC72_9FUSO|nr:flagellar hook-associated protein FlgL [Haliovirga abyssi]BDU51081.1 flagellar hook-associated protein FlgL [Haliovirga abyssi]